MLKYGWNVHFSGWSLGWQLGIRVVSGVDLIVVWVWCEVTGYGRSALFDQGHGGRSFSLVGMPVLLNGDNVGLAWVWKACSIERSRDDDCKRNAL